MLYFDKNNSYFNSSLIANTVSCSPAWYSSSIRRWYVAPSMKFFCLHLSKKLRFCELKS